MLTVGANKTLEVDGTLTVDGGTLSAAAGTLNADGNVEVTSGTLTLPSGTDSYVKGNWTVATVGTTLNHSNGSLTFNGSAEQTITTGGKAFKHLTISNNVIVSGVLDVNGLLTLSSGGLDLDTYDPDVTVGGGMTIDETADAVTRGSGTWTFDGTGNYTDSTAQVNYNLGDVIVNGTSLTTLSSMSVNSISVTGGLFDISTSPSTLTVASSLLINGGTLNALNGTLNIDGALELTTGTLTMPSGITSYAKGDWTIAAVPQAVFNNSQGMLTFNGTQAQTVTTGGKAFHHLILSNNVIVSGVLDVNGLLTLSSGILDLDTYDPNVFVGGGITIDAGTVTRGSGTWTFDGTGNYTDNTAGSIYNLGDVIVNGVNATLTAATRMVVNSLTISNGTLALSQDKTLSVMGALTINSNGSGGTGTLNAANGTVDVNGNFVISAGSLNPPSGIMYVSGNWTNDTGSALTLSAGTVIIDGVANSVSTLSGSNSFYNFSCSIQRKILKFPTNAATTVTNRLVLAGQKDNSIQLCGAGDGSGVAPLHCSDPDAQAQWQLNVNKTLVGASHLLQYLRIKNSDASRNADSSSSGTSMLLTRISVDVRRPEDSNNPLDTTNSNWKFGFTIKGRVFSDEGSTLAGAGIHLNIINAGELDGSAGFGYFVSTDGSSVYEFRNVNVRLE